MSLFTDIASSLADGVSKLFDSTVKLRTAVTGKDPEIEGQVEILQQQVEALKVTAQQASDASQSAIEQASLGVTGTNFFKFWVAGARPLILWSCGAAFGLQYVIVPILHWFGWMVPDVDMGVPTKVALGLLGVSGIITRSVEKVKGAAQNH